MPPFRLCLAWFPLALLLSPARPFAQALPTDSLGGKTVHVYLPDDGMDTLLVEAMNVRMKKDSGYWHSYTFTQAGLYDYQDGFYFSDPPHRLFLFKTGLGTAETSRFKLADFRGRKEIWIVIDPTGPVTAAPVILTQAPRVVNILNPWPLTAPKLVSGDKTVNMTVVDGHCGWFSAMLLDTAVTEGYFEEVNNTETYGRSGVRAIEPFDLAALFAANGPEIWLNTQDRVWTASFPGLVGQCGYALSLTVRDFSQAHPDFDFGALSGEHLLKGMVLPDIGSDRRPVLNTANSTRDPAVSFSRFDEWWVTDSTRPAPFRNYESCYELPMDKSGDGSWGYDSYRDSPDHGFWPVEGPLNRFTETVASCYVKPPPDSNTWISGGPRRNGNFCAESHAEFVYAPGQKFAFRGDDDAWAFINGKLVIDLGGPHTPKSDSVDLDKLGLIAGKIYTWDFFYCDRQPCGSALRIKTSIYFRQQRRLYGLALPGAAPGSVSLEIWKRSDGTGTCGIVRNAGDSAKAAHLIYQLLDGSGKLVKELANPGTFFGGITIAEPIVTVDTAKISGGELAAGAAYRLVAFEAGDPMARVELPFRVSAGSVGLKAARGKKAFLRPAARARNLLGRHLAKPL